MKLDSLSLRGLLRFTDTVTLDVASLPPGLIAFVGQNGGGKTTLLEQPLACLYRSFPSRDKELFDYAHDRDSFAEAVFAFDDGTRYRARVNVDGIRRLSEAVLERTHPDGTREILNDGKVSTFDQAVAQHFPPRSVLLASAFSAQNRAGSFISLDRRGRKDLFARLLGLDHYEAMAQTARTAGSLVEQARVRLVAGRDVIARQCGAELDGQLAGQDAGLQFNRTALDADRARLQVDIADTEARLATVADQVAAFAVATQRVTAVEREQFARLAEEVRLQTVRTAIDSALTADRRRIADAKNRRLAELDNATAKSGRTLVDEADAIARTLATTLQDIETRIANNRGLLTRSDEIRAAVERVAEIEAHLATARMDEATWRQAHTSSQAALRSMEQALLIVKLAQKDLARAGSDAQLVDDVPCQASGAYAGCQFLRQALEAKARIPALTEQAARGTTLQTEQDRWAADWQAAGAQLTLIATTIAALEKDKAAQTTTAKLATTLIEAETRIAELSQKRVEATQAAEQATAAATARAAERTRDLATQRTAAEADASQAAQDLETRAAAQQATADADLAAIATTLQNLATQLLSARAALAETEAGHQQAAALQGALSLLRARWDESTRALAQLEAARQDIERQRRELAARRAELADVDTRLSNLDTELVEWQLLAKALGRDGLPVLEIDAAGPTVSAFANDLLASCFGPRFSIELVTQEAKAGGKGMKESFDIKVFDNERGGDARDIGDLSGGEQIIVAEALANAIALAANRRSDHPIRTCWRDETTGPLDAENAARYVPMLRKLQELGGFEKVIFVSHNPESAALADAQVRFADGQVSVAVPPYAA